MYADFYPLWMVWHEALLVSRRKKQDLANETMSRYTAAVAASPKQGKKAKQAAEKSSKLLMDFIKGLTDG